MVPHQPTSSGTLSPAMPASTTTNAVSYTTPWDTILISMHRPNRARIGGLFIFDRARSAADETSRMAFAC